MVRRLGFQALSCSAGAGNWFGAAGWRAGSTGYRRADVVMPHHLGMGRHLFLDVAVTDPGVGAALTARPSPSSSSSGVAAELRAQKKVQKYEGLAAAVDSSFCPAVIERYGAVCDALLAASCGGCVGMGSGARGSARITRSRTRRPGGSAPDVPGSSAPDVQAARRRSSRRPGVPTSRRPGAAHRREEQSRHDPLRTLPLRCP